MIDSMPNSPGLTRAEATELQALIEREQTDFLSLTMIDLRRMRSLESKLRVAQEIEFWRNDIQPPPELDNAPNVTST